MNITRRELQRQLRGRPTVRRHPTFGPNDDKDRPDPAMAPTRGMTPAFGVKGSKKYVHFGSDRVAVAQWSDDRERVPVRWLSYDEWRAFRWPESHVAITGAA